MPVSEIMWVEKYRPKKIPEIVNQKEILGSLQGLLKNQVQTNKYDVLKDLINEVAHN